MCAWVEQGSRRWLSLHAQGWDTNLKGNLFSSFSRLVQGHLKALNHHSFSSLPYFYKSRTSQFFSPSQHRGVWCEARAQSNVMSSSCVLQSSFSLISAGYIIFWKLMQFLMVTPAYTLHMDVTSSSLPPT